MKKDLEMTSSEFGSPGEAALQGASAAPPPRLQTKHPKQLGTAYPVRLEHDVEAAINKLCSETPLSKAAILRLSCRAGLEAIDWTTLKILDLNLTGEKVKPTQPPSVPQRIHGVAENKVSSGELGEVVKAIGDPNPPQGSATFAGPALAVTDPRLNNQAGISRAGPLGGEQSRRFETRGTMNKLEVPIDGPTARMQLSANGKTPMGQTRFTALKRQLGMTSRYVLVSKMRRFLNEHPEFRVRDVYPRKDELTRSHHGTR